MSTKEFSTINFIDFQPIFHYFMALRNKNFHIKINNLTQKQIKIALLIETAKKICDINCEN